MNPILTPGTDEETDQILFVNWVARTYPEIAPCLHHSPNGGYRDSRTGQRMKLMGTRKGFHDLILFHPVPPHAGLVIEMKLGTGRLTREQQEWIHRYRACGFVTRTCWGLAEAQQTFMDYLETPPCP